MGDADNDGVVSADEARAALNDSMDSDALEAAVESLVGPEGEVAFTSFMGELLASKAADENRILWREFTRLDTDGTGYLDRNEVAQLLRRPALAHLAGTRDVSDLMSLMDADG